MSWGEIFFGFHGRIDRKTYWFATILAGIAGLCFNALLAYLATGNPFSPDVWQRPADKSAIWAPVWLAYFLFLAWPSATLAVKRLHDRGRPVWIWYAYYGGTFVLTLVPLGATAGAETTQAAGVLAIILMIFAVYVFFELGVLRGAVGANEHGEDTLPPGYYGGDYSFWSWMLAFEGRISREKWWQGFFILAGACFAVTVLSGLLLGAFATRHPELDLVNPDWLDSDQAKPLLLPLLLLISVPSFVYLFALWSFVALGVKRLHDRGLSSWLILVVVLPFFGALASPAIAARFELGESLISLAFLLLMASAIWSVLQFGIFNGDTGPNQHGPDPLAGRG